MKKAGAILNLHASFIFAINYSKEYLVGIKIQDVSSKGRGVGIKVVRAADKINLYSAYLHGHF